MNLENIRNFAIISHIDHGKSTLADRLLELTGAVSKREMKEQFLDSMELEREKGITIKMRPVRMLWRPQMQNAKYKMQNDNLKFKNNSPQANTKILNFDFYILNLIDTPGHTDFSYEVSRALAAAEGAVLLVDATQGIQAQTIANVELAKSLNLKILAAVNKIDLKEARIEEVKKDIGKLLKCEEKEILEISAKYGTGVEKLIQAIIQKIPPPNNLVSSTYQVENPRALIFDFEYSAHKGIIAFVRVFDGALKKDEELYLNKAGVKFKAKEIGYLTPDYSSQEKIFSGEIGYIITNLKEPSMVRVGDTITSFINPLPVLSGYKESHPVIWSNFFPSSQQQFEELNKALLKLSLNDSSLSFEEIHIPSIGRGFRMGFLGMLHLEIISERLKREFKIETINTLPSVAYLIQFKDGKKEKIYSANDFPDDFKINSVFEFWVKAEILTPEDKLSAISRLIQDYEGIIEKVDNFSSPPTNFSSNKIEKETNTEAWDKTQLVGGKNRLIIKTIMPLRELMRGFFDSLKSVSSGYASFNYELDETENLKKAEVVRLDILINEEEIPSLSRIVPLSRLYKEAEDITDKLKNLLPPALYVLKIQAKAKGRIIASRSISALKKNVTGYLYGGDRTRKMKLWQKQKKGKEKLREKSRYTIPSDVFLKVMK